MPWRFLSFWWLLALLPTLCLVWWLALRSDSSLSKGRRIVSAAIRTVVVLCLILTLSGFEWLRPLQGMNVFFALDRSDSMPPSLQEASRAYVNQADASKQQLDKSGVVVFGAESGVEYLPSAKSDLQKIHAVVSTERTDISTALRLATAAFPETGQRRVVLLSDGNENIGDALAAVTAARPLGVTVDVVPVGATRANDVSVQKVALPNRLKLGQTFEVKIFARSDTAQSATVRLFRDNQYLASQPIQLTQGKNLFSFPQSLDSPGFHSYEVQIEAPGDSLPQNNRAVNFTYVRGDPSVLLVSSSPAADNGLVEALRSSRLEVKTVDVAGFPAGLAEMQAYDSIVLCNVSAGDLGLERLKLLESAVRDFGVGVVCVGGDDSFAAGGYRGTPLETLLPLEMELSSKKVLPSGALVIVVHATEFPNGNQWARDIAFAALTSLGPQDEMGIILWNGNENWLFELQKVGDKKSLGKSITGMQPGDMVAFVGPMERAHEALKKSNSSLKHMVVFSDGDPSAPPSKLLQDIVADKITISSVMIGGHVAPETMVTMADVGRGRFYDVRSPTQLPQIFIKEAAVILKSAIFEEPFQPKMVASSEVVRGFGATEFPSLLGYVATTPKSRAEVPLVTDKGDPLLAHWQYGLGRSVAFTSDARAKWGKGWVGWSKYRQFWSQAVQWSLRKIESSDFVTDVTVDQGEGRLRVEALDKQGNFRNFLNLEAAVVSPKGEKQTVRLNQTGPGHYEGLFKSLEVGAYLINLLERKEGNVIASQVLGASVNYSPEFAAIEPNIPLLRRIAEAGGGRMLDLRKPLEGPFSHDRMTTRQPLPLFDWLMRLAILLFPIDVAVRRVQIDTEEWKRFFIKLLRRIPGFRRKEEAHDANESLGSLLATREAVRAQRSAPVVEVDPDLFRPQQTPVAGSTVGGTIQPRVDPPGRDTESPAGGSQSSAAEPSTTSRLLEAKKRAQKKP